MCLPKSLAARWITKGGGGRASLLLKPIFFANACVEKEALGFVFRFYDYAGVATLAIFGLVIVSTVRGVQLETAKNAR